MYTLATKRRKTITRIRKNQTTTQRRKWVDGGDERGTRGGGVTFDTSLPSQREPSPAPSTQTNNNNDRHIVQVN